MLTMLLILVGMFIFIPLIIFPIELINDLKSKKRGVPNYLLSFLVTAIPILLFLFLPPLKAIAPDLTSLTGRDEIMIVVWYGLIFGSFAWDIKKTIRFRKKPQNLQQQTPIIQTPGSYDKYATVQQIETKMDELVKQGNYGIALHLYPLMAHDQCTQLLSYLAQKLLKVIYDENETKVHIMHAVNVLREIKETDLIEDKALLYKIIDIVEH